MKSWLLFTIAAPMVIALPIPAKADPRVQHIVYRLDDVVRVAGTRGIQTMLVFAEDEHIENIALGDAAAWQVTPNRRGNLIFLKPLLATRRTNMSVITDQHRYLFELVSVKASARVKYSIQFIYPEPVHLTPTPTPAPPSPVSVSAAPAPLPVNTQWQVRGDNALSPARVYDDGHTTFIAWPSSRDLPAVLVQGPDGLESPATFVERGGYLEVEGVARRYVLRLGKLSTILNNLAYAVSSPALSPAPSTTQATAP